MINESDVRALIDTALGITITRNLSDSEKLCALNGWLQGRRKELLGECLSVTEFPECAWLKPMNQQRVVIMSKHDKTKPPVEVPFSEI